MLQIEHVANCPDWQARSGIAHAPFIWPRNVTLATLLPNPHSVDKIQMAMGAIMTMKFPRPRFLRANWGGFTSVASVGALLGMFCSVVAAQNFPERDLRIIVPTPPGSLTDIAIRVVARSMEEQLGAMVQIENRPGGRGFIAAQEFAQVDDSDYTLLGFSDAHLQSISLSVPGGIEGIYPLLIAGSPIVLFVGADSEYENLNDLMESDSLTVTAGPPGSTSHIALSVLQGVTQIEARNLAFSSTDGVVAAASGAVDVGIGPFAQLQSALSSDSVRLLAVFSQQSYELGGDIVPSALEVAPELEPYLPLSQLVGMAFLADASADAKEAVTEAFNMSISTDEFQNWASENGLIISGATGDEAQNELRPAVNAAADVFCGGEICKDCPEECSLCTQCLR
ncbi:MAG TPA: tripartite tricarboxylate transporter substrate-binding protein [Afifellaceae bacterium]|nr:tripartite tricarboxylate transporter substrate-binding protein [Afifellaceae bacterium]